MVFGATVCGAVVGVMKAIWEFIQDRPVNLSQCVVVGTVIATIVFCQYWFIWSRRRPADL